MRSKLLDLDLVLSCEWISSMSSLMQLMDCISLAFPLIKWGLSLFTSDIWTGFRKNSSAPSSKHLIQNPSPKSYISTIEWIIWFWYGVIYVSRESCRSDEKIVWFKNTPKVNFPHLLILEGTFSDDMITTGISFRSVDSWKLQM